MKRRDAAVRILTQLLSATPQSCLELDKMTFVDLHAVKCFLKGHQVSTLALPLDRGSGVRRWFLEASSATPANRSFLEGQPLTPFGVSTKGRMESECELVRCDSLVEDEEAAYSPDTTHSTSCFRNSRGKLGTVSWL